MKKSSYVALLLCLSLALAACGSQSGGQPAPSTPEAGQQQSPSAADSAPAQSDASEPAAQPEQSEPDTQPRLQETAQGTAILSISSGGGQSVSESGAFTAADGDVLVLEVQSTISGGTVDLFLFDPQNNEFARFTFSGDSSEVILLSAGTWAWNCTGFFQSGEFLLSGALQ